MFESCCICGSTNVFLCMNGKNIHIECNSCGAKTKECEDIDHAEYEWHHMADNCFNCEHCYITDGDNIIMCDKHQRETIFDATCDSFMEDMEY